MSEVLHITDDNFEAEITNSEIPVLVDFSATWCGPCKKLEPIIEELAGEYSGKLKIAHVDVDKARQSAMKFGVMSVPTVLYMVGGEIKDTQIGLIPKDKMVEKIEGIL
ncbi:MAG: thioredoxin [Candidatus Krumholzibacteria bacterium]|jgi:thioredoxin 1|nr:thioredoxin [Candidatus Krumholzibacteria bacterium]MDP6669289.1 thioredoxin [Candidatus Krumholzibacteria bacterium]MDP6796688.1 thioredoxin [Candidatus Krumholzibacteria bacterium]MDP7020745.1 thioredoxin [Candidatus Krumholzibacteria bacterium]